MRKIDKNHKIDPRIDANEYRLVWRSITNSTNERTLIATILSPNLFLGNSLNYLKPLTFDGEKYIRPISYYETVFICGIFNSFVIDYILRHKIATNLNTFYLMELPIPRYDENNALHKKIVENATKLICTTNEYSDLRNEIKFSETTLKSNDRLILESQINAMVVKIYSLTDQELKFVLENFPIADKKLKERTLIEFNMMK